MQTTIRLFSIGILVFLLCSKSIAQCGNFWTQKADFGGTAREEAVGFAIGGKGYIGTGFDGTFKKDFWEYDTTSNTWAQKADFGGVARWKAVGFDIGGKGYIGTGSDSSAYKKDFWEYDTASNAWTQKTNFGGLARYDAVGFSIGSKGYIGTGWYSLGFLKDFWEYDTASNAWTQKTNFGGTARAEAVGFAIGGRGYIGTGLDGSSKKDFWEYDTTSNAWTQKADLSGSVRRSAVGFVIGGKGYIGTGFYGNVVVKKDFWEYDRASNSWTQIADLTGAKRLRAVGFSIGRSGYVGTGVDGPYKKDFWEYRPPLLSAYITVTNLTCSGGNDGTAITSATGTPPYTYLWSTSDTTDSIGGLTAGTYTVLVTDSQGCSVNDSANIIEPPVIQSSVADTICDNDSIFLQGAYQNTTGTYYDTLTAINGCDSIHSTVLSVNSSYSISDSPIDICDSALIYGIYRTTSGTYYDSLSTNGGCDSVHSTVLSVNPTYSISDSSKTICNGDSSLIYGTFRTTSGTYFDSLSTVAGCDSVHSTMLFVSPIYSINDSAISICDGDSSLIYGTYRTTSGSYYDSLSSIDGCDSVHSTVLSVNPTYSISDSSKTICNGDSSLIYGTYRTTSGTYFDSLSTVAGCDSVHFTMLSVDLLPSVSFSGLDSAYCSTDAGVILTGVPSGGIFSGTGGVAGNKFYPATGIDMYLVTYSYTDSLGCSNSDSQSVSVVQCIGINEQDEISQLKIYPNPNSGEFTVSMTLENTPNFELKVFNNLGEQVFTEPVERIKGSYEKRINLNGRAAGVYNVQFIFAGETINRTIIIE